MESGVDSEDGVVVQAVPIMQNDETSTTDTLEQEAEPSTREATPSERHPLRYHWTFFFVKRQPAINLADTYEKNIKKIGGFGTVEEFWAFYNHLVRPNDQLIACDYHLFKTGIKPMWEDETNRKGGKFAFRVSKKRRLSSKYWEDLLLALVGDQFGEDGQDICGIVVSIRNTDDVFSVWTKNAANIEQRGRLAERIKQLLGLPPNLSLDYKSHDQSIRENSNFQSRVAKSDTVIKAQA
ncbi:eukaryotic translation initiation factor 4E type 2-like [Schistocerca gregaria]|uniref:eukaryotic translation initiation factor 4E type 2-like n=1 Tax=Schistocerca gregaria TaxID=7010 RepID=UPI00211EFAFE|nr:eukaryotic translation initiation factor 4E type 2-like [Schistocerca gregaria]